LFALLELGAEGNGDERRGARPAPPRAPRPPGRKAIITSVERQEGEPSLPVEPGLCAMCRYAAVKGTNRGTVYLRCTRASWDDRLVKYPRLPVRDCVGFARDGIQDR
jgi:hypothetical protein